jgi:hypothetical protein
VIVIMSDFSEKSENETIQEDESYIGFDDLHTERCMDVAAAIGTGGSGFPPEDAIRRDQPLSCNLPLYM